MAGRVAVWDLPTRLFHWALVLLIALSWWSHEDNLALHRLSGYAIVSLLVFRLWWGFAGPSTARFSGMLGGPARVRAYLKGQTAPAVGHNPLGGWSVAAMLAALVAQVTLGLFSIDTDGLDSGPFARFVSYDAARVAAETHEVVFTVLLGLIALHIAAIVVYAVRGKNLVGPMLDGKAEGTEALRPARRISLVVGGVLAAAAFAALLWQSKAAGLALPW